MYSTATSNAQDSSLPEKTRLAKRLNEKGWLMYGPPTCSACLAQRKMFGEAFVHIRAFAYTADDRRIILTNKDTFDATQIFKRGFFQCEPERLHQI